ncbi:MAG: hypothetical protein ACYTGF_00025 [Planctomycetota bacterium]
MSDTPWRLRALSPAVRVGLTCLVLTALGGLAASAHHIVAHHQDRDEQPGLSLDDIRGAYHGVRTTASLVISLERDHPADVTEDPALLLTAQERDVLTRWLASDRISEDYDNLDLGDAAPAEIMAARCVACHSRQATLGDGVGERIPLDYWDDVKRVAFSREINPVDVEILATSMHTHALSLATLSIVAAAMALGTAWPRRLVHGLIAVMGIALVADIGGWWLARPWGGAIWIIVVGGGVYVAVLTLTLLAVLVELWRPVSEKAP